MDHGDRRAIVAAFLANVGIAAAKFVGFLATGAASMLAESVHSMADTGNQGLLLLGAARSQRDPTAEHPFGFGRERYFWSFVVALVLFTAGGLFALVEATHKLVDPEEPTSPGWALGILAVAFGLELFSLRTASGEARASKGARSWWRFIRESKRAELPVVLLEDTGALLGLLFAATGIVLATVTGDGRFDALGSLAIGLLLVTFAVVLAVEMKSLLIGEAVSDRDLARIRGALEAEPSVATVLDLRTLQLGPDEELVTARFRPGAVEGAVDAVARVSRTIAATTPGATVYLEPRDDADADAGAGVRGTATVVGDHLERLRRGDLEADLEANFHPGVVVLTPDGAARGRAAAHRLLAAASPTGGRDDVVVDGPFAVVRAGGAGLGYVVSGGTVVALLALG